MREEGSGGKKKKSAALKACFPSFSAVCVFVLCIVVFLQPPRDEPTWKRAVKTHPGSIVGLIFSSVGFIPNHNDAFKAAHFHRLLTDFKCIEVRLTEGLIKGKKKRGSFSSLITFSAENSQANFTAKSRAERGGGVGGGTG